MTVYRNYIGGEWHESASERTAPNLNPANTDDVLGTVKLSTRDEARRAVEAAAEAFRGWRATPAPVRGRGVGRFARRREAGAFPQSVRRVFHGDPVHLVGKRSYCRL